MIAETDHVFMKPLPNLASPTEAAAHSFGYMHASPRHNGVVKLCWPEGDYSSLQPVGPSPVIIYLPSLKKVAQRWLDYSYILRGNPEPARMIQDWVLEMWGYSIAAASVAPSCPGASSGSSLGHNSSMRARDSARNVRLTRTVARARSAIGRRLAGWRRCARAARPRGQHLRR